MSDTDGDTPLEKVLNAYLTKQFIISGDAPTDECLKEAREIIELLKKCYVTVCSDCGLIWKGQSPPKVCCKKAKFIIKEMREGIYELFDV